MKRMCRWLGWQVEDMWTTFVPGIDEATWRTAAKMVADDMNEGLHAGKGALFPGVERDARRALCTRLRSCFPFELRQTLLR